MQTLEYLDLVIKELKNAKVESHQHEAIEAIEKAVNALEVSKRNIYTLQVISKELIPEVPNEWVYVDRFGTCMDLARRALRKDEPKEVWLHPLKD